MDLEDEEWVNVPYDLGLLEAHDGDDEKIFSRNYAKSTTKFYKPNYFDTPTTYQDKVEEEPIFENQMDHKKEVKEIIKESKKSSFEPELELKLKPELNQDPIFHVFYKKENQFVEMTASLQQDEKHVDVDHEVNCSSPSKMTKKEVVAWNKSNQKRVNFWKWGLSGIGVFCYMGMTAATICIILCGNGRRHKLQNQKLRIQIYPENKRIKQVVHRANEAMSAMRGVPLVKAQITYGGHYESI